MTRIYCIGELLVDNIGDDRKSLKENNSFSKRAGGAPANVAVAASRLGADVSKVATVGNDEFGDFLIERLEKEDVETKNIRREGKTTLAFVALDKQAKPHFSFYRDADKNIKKSQLDLNATDQDIVHLGSLPWTDKSSAKNIIEFVENTSAMISFDPNIRKELLTEQYKQTLREIVAHTDILVAAEDELDLFGGLESLKERVNEIIVTKGEKGAELHKEGKSFSVEAYETEVVDTTGAGDCLTGSYLAFRSQGSEEALSRAVRSAELSTTSKGAMEALPYKKDLNKRLSK